MIKPGVPSAEPTVFQFLLAWQSKHYLQAAELTTGQPATVAAALAGAYERLDASDIDLTMRSVSQQGATATAEFGASIDLASSGLTWSYTGGFRLQDGGDGWRVRWSPSVIVPGMTSHDQLAVVSYWQPRSQLLDTDGQPLTVPSQVYKVGVYPDELADPARTAADLAAVTQIPADQIEAQIEENLQGDFLELITYTPGEYAKMRARLSAIPGLEVRKTTERLFDSIAPDVVGTVGTETASILRTDGVEYLPGTTVGLSGLQQTFQRQLTGTPSTNVVLQQQSGLPAVVLKSWPGSPGTPVRTTLDADVQLAADHALAGSPDSAAIVAVQAQTGKILAVASRSAGGMPALYPLSGQYEPGQSFTIVSSAAILAAGKTPGDPVPCGQSNVVDGRTFVNDPPEPNLGANPSFREDFAHACATAFAGLSESLTGSELTEAADKFGIGGWQLPVSSYFAGQLGPPVGLARLAADAIGIGNVQVSPLGMALVAAVVDSGEWHAPSLVAGRTDISSVPRGVESPQVLAALRELMRGAAATGSNKVADIGGDVFAQVGDAPFGNKMLNIDWYVGYQGDIAFAVVQLSKSASASAAPLAGSFLQNIRAGS